MTTAASVTIGLLPWLPGLNYVGGALPIPQAQLVAACQKPSGGHFD
jgi:hypothetical protein